MRRPLQLAAALPLLLVLALVAACSSGSSEPEGWAPAALDAATVYYFPKKDRLSSLTLGATGNQIAWTFPDKDRQGDKDIDLVSVYGQPVLDGGRLYLGTYEGEVYALNAADGSIAWRQLNIKGSIVEGPSLAQGRLAFGTTSGYLYVLNATDGSPAAGWEKPKKFPDGIWAAPVLSNAGTLYVGTMGGRVFAFNLADGSDAWPQPFATEGAIATLTLVDDAHLFVPTLAKKVFLIDTATGQATAPVLVAADWVWTTPAVKDGIAYFGDFSGRIYALDITSGTVDWVAEAGDRVKSGPAITDDVLVVVDRSPAVHFLDLRTGKIRNTVPIASAGTVRANVRLAAASSPLATKAVIVTTKGKLFVADPRGQVVELTVAEGSP